MSTKPGWDVVSRIADVFGIMTVLVAIGLLIASAAGVEVSRSTKYQAVLVAMLGSGVGGVALLISGIARIRDAAKSFESDRGRGSTFFVIAGFSSLLISAGFAIIYVALPS